MRLIDADKLTYQSHTQHLQSYINKKDIDNAPTLNAVVIKEGMTNGDVIRALFPNISIVNVFGGDIWFKVDNSYLQCSESWWNSPYKGE